MASVFDGRLSLWVAALFVCPGRVTRSPQPGRGRNSGGSCAYGYVQASPAYFELPVHLQSLESTECPYNKNY